MAMFTCLTSGRNRLFLILLGTLLLFSCVPKRSKPEEQNLIVSYHLIGWSADASHLHFVKALKEQRDYRWGSVDSETEHWIPETTHVRFVVCRVNADGTDRRELFSVPESANLPDNVFDWPYGSDVLDDESVVLSYSRAIWRVSQHSAVRLADTPADYTEVRASPDRKLVCANFHMVGLHLFNLSSNTVERLTSGYELSPRWSPDGRKLLFIHSSNSHMKSEFRLLDVVTREESVILETAFSLGYPIGANFDWTEPEFIWLREEYAQDLKSTTTGIRFRPTPPFLSYGSSRIARAGLYSESTSKGLRILSDPASSHSSEPLVLFTQKGRTVEVAHNSDWDKIISRERDANGQIW